MPKLNRSLRTNLLLMALLFLTALLVAGQKYESVIKGRVVDVQGRPVENALIEITKTEESKSENCYVKTETTRSDRNGNFQFEDFCDASRRTVLLYVVPSVDYEKVETPIYPLFWKKLQQSDPAFAGYRVIVEGNATVDAGDIPMQIRYRELELYILNKKGEPFYKTKNDWFKFILFIRNERGDDVGNETLSTFDVNNKVNLEKGFLRMALPEGTWTMEMVADWDDYDNKTGATKRHLAKTVLKVNESIGRAVLTVK